MKRGLSCPPYYSAKVEAPAIVNHRLDAGHACCY